MSANVGINLKPMEPDDFLKKLIEEDFEREKTVYHSLEFEPLYGCCRLAVVGLFALQDERERAKDPKLKPRKYRIYIRNSKIFIENDQDVTARLTEHFVAFYQDPQWIQTLKKHITRCLHWYPPEVKQLKETPDKEYSRRTIYKFTMIGLEILKLSLKLPEHEDSADCLTKIGKKIKKALDGKQISSKKFPNIQIVRSKKEKQAQGKEEVLEKVSEEEEREWKLYTKCTSIWSLANEQSIKNTILEAQTETLRTILNEILKRYKA